MEIRWTQEALGQLIEIEEFISRDSPERGAHFVDGIIDHMEASLPVNPRMGRTVPEIANPNLRELLFRNYRIVYRLTESALEILTVFEGHRLFRIDEIE